MDRFLLPAKSTAAPPAQATSSSTTTAATTASAKQPQPLSGPFALAAKRQRVDADAPAHDAPEPRTIVVWNANALLHRVDKDRAQLQAFLAQTSPDVLYVSEVRMPAEGPAGAKAGDGRPRMHDKLSTATKAAREEAERLKTFISAAGYRVYWSLADKKYSGSALLVKRSCAQPHTLRFSLEPGGGASAAHDPEGRVVLASFRTFELLGTYVPNNGSTEESFKRRRDWDARVRAFLIGRRANAAAAAAVPGGPVAIPLIWGGDLNVAAGWDDVGPDPDWFRHKNGQHADPDNSGQPGFTPNEQTRFAELLRAGNLLDAHRLTHPEPDWQRDATWRGTPGAPPNPPEYGRYYGKGMRIDYVLIEAALRARLARTEVLGHSAERRGFVGSDHCPLLLELSPAAGVAAVGTTATSQAAAASGTADDGASAAAAAAAATAASTTAATATAAATAAADSDLTWLSPGACRLPARGSGGGGGGGGGGGALPPLLFLDVDGVLNCATTVDDAGAFRFGSWPYPLAPALLARLKEVLDATRAKLVLSTQWRKSPDGVAALGHGLARAGIGCAAVVGATADLGGKARAVEILSWVREHVEGSGAAWVAVDDLNLLNSAPPSIGDMRGHVVRTEFATGLTAEAAQQCIDVLRRGA